MANSVLTIDVIAKEALMHLDNNLVAAKLVHRGHESDFGNAMNGYGDDYFIARKGEIKSIADLKGRPVAVISHGSAPHTSVKRMLEKLVELGYVRAERNFAARKTSPYRYRLDDPALQFHAALVGLFRSELATYAPLEVWAREIVGPRLDTYMGTVFERIARESDLRSTNSPVESPVHRGEHCAERSAEVEQGSSQAEEVPGAEGRGSGDGHVDLRGSFAQVRQEAVRSVEMNSQARGEISSRP